MNQNPTVLTRTVSGVSVNKVVRNTYLLLSMTLLFSAVTAGLSMVLQVPPVAYLLSTFGAFGLIWLVLPRYANRAGGVGVVFGITGLLGFGLGPILNLYLQMANGAQIVGTALGGTGIIFLALSAYALTTKRDFNFLGGFLFTGFLVVLLASLANIFLAIPALTLAISAAVIMIMSGFILFDTSRMVNGGETNYVVATVGLYLSIFNIFISLLNILGIARND
ncbi:MAG: Bax inhibitor-1/YccA family protein [Acidiferrobacterales bacterium]